METKQTPEEEAKKKEEESKVKVEFEEHMKKVNTPRWKYSPNFKGKFWRAKMHLKDTLNNWLPSPIKTISLLLIITWLGAIVSYWPDIMMLLLKPYVNDIPLMGSAVIALTAVVLFQIAFLVILYIFAGKWMIPPLLARIYGVNILLEWYNQTNFRFIVPSKMHKGAWELNDDEVAMITPGSVGVSPHKIGLAIGIPEIGRTITAREVIEGCDESVNFGDIKQFGRWKKLEGYEQAAKEEKGTDWMKVIGILGVFTIIFLVIAPFAYKMFGDYSVSSTCQTQLMQITSRQGCSLYTSNQTTMPVQQQTYSPPATITLPVQQSTTGAGMTASAPPTITQPQPPTSTLVNPLGLPVPNL